VEANGDECEWRKLSKQRHIIHEVYCNILGLGKNNSASALINEVMKYGLIMYVTLRPPESLNMVTNIVSNASTVSVNY
jgi:hypothetical protein